MRRLLGLMLLCCSLAALTAIAAAAQAESMGAAAPAASAPAAGKATAGFQADLVADLDEAMDHLLQLADAMPADKYGWRPGEGVRSFAEVLGHVAAGYYAGAASLGTPVPAGVDPGKLEAVSDKAAAIASLRAAVDHFKAASAAVETADLDTPVDLFGMKLNKRRVMLLMQGHGHEHTGQAIAYARMNGVVPPWSRPQPKAGG
ncbi:MAG TPA: DinB family protein [Thermoanaerobaculia bacterium]|jgi:uncharacterized damage-inducible protein DinB|nr:DinB family protein [Thermoanaerobaculia bacterium]